MENVDKYNDLFFSQLEIAEKDPKRFTKLPKLTIITKKINAPSNDAPKKKYKWEVTSLEENYKFDRATSDGTDKLDSFDWNNSDIIKGVERSSSGNEGLFFVDTTMGMVIIKRSAPQEFFCSNISFLLGIQAPTTRLLFNKEGELGCKVVMKMVEKDKSGRVMTTLVNQKHLLMMQYFRGVTLSHVSYEMASKMFNTKGVLESIGEMLVLDVLCNNSDRFPVIWDNQGNGGNVMFSETGVVVAIDSSITIISNLEKKENYLKNVRSLIESLVNDVNKPTKQFGRVRDLIVGCTEYDIQEEGVVKIQKAFFELLKKHANLDITSHLNKWMKELQKIEVNNLDDAFYFVSDLFIEIHLVMSGENKSSGNKQIENFDVPKDVSWSSVENKNTPAPRRYHSSVLLDEGLLIFGGMQFNKNITNAAYFYNFSNTEWNLVTAENSFPHDGLFGHSFLPSSLSPSSSFFVFGGATNEKGNPSNLVTQVNYENGKISFKEIETGGDKPPGLFHHGAVIIGDKMYVYGGKISLNKFNKDLYILDLKSFQWKILEAKNKPEERYGHLFFHHDGYLYIYGGNDEEKDFPNMYRISLSSDSWEKIENSGVPPSVGRPLTSAYSPQGYVFCYGGYDRVNKIDSRSLKTFDIKLLKWRDSHTWAHVENNKTLTSLSVGSKGTEIKPRYGHSINLTKDFDLVLFAGCASTYLNDMVVIKLVD